MIKNQVARAYSYWTANRGKFTRRILPWVLVACLILGAGYRSIVLKENFEIWNGFGHFLSLASNYHQTWGKYNWDEGVWIENNPDDYVYTQGGSNYKAHSSISNEIGWPFILSLILPDGLKGVNNLANVVARYQVMLDLLVVVFFFFAGRSLAGAIGAILAPLTWAIFKMPMVMSSWIVYYYWPIPFSALCLMIWTAFYRPENVGSHFRRSLLLFFVFGLITGFAANLRLHFLLLPLVLAPLVPIREKSLKRGLALVLAMFIGHFVFLTPMVMLNKYHHGQYAITTRGGWHGILQGVGAYPNPWGIKDSGEVNLNKWIIDQGGPDLNTAGTQVWDEWSKHKVFELMKERPDVFWRNFKNNFHYGLTISTHYFQFFGLIDTMQEGLRLAAIFPWLVLSSLLLLFFLSRRQFWIAVGICLQGLYFLLVVTMYFINYIPWLAAYIPVFAFVLALSIAIWLKALLAAGEAGLRLWLEDRPLKDLPRMIVETYTRPLTGTNPAEGRASVGPE